MGGLKSHLPVTYRTFLVGAIAIAGIFPFSGFFSKDEILWKAFAGGQWGFWLMGLAGAFMTAFYMFRLVTLTFDGEPRWAPGKHPHEAPKTMTVPLMILALLSLIGRRTRDPRQPRRCQRHRTLAGAGFSTGV